VEAGDYQNSVFLNLEEDSIGKTPDAYAPSSSLDNRKLKRVFCNCLNCIFHRTRNALAKFRANVVVPAACLLEFGLCFRQPDDRKGHSFLYRCALTCSQGMTSEGFFWCRSMR
jgi:hypothetical protein